MSKIKAVLNSANYRDVESFGLLNGVKIFGKEKSFGHQVFSAEENLKSGDKLDLVVKIDNRINKDIIDLDKVVGNCNLSLFIDDVEVLSTSELNKDTYPWTFHLIYYVK